MRMVGTRIGMGLELELEKLKMDLIYLRLNEKNGIALKWNT